VPLDQQPERGRVVVAGQPDQVAVGGFFQGLNGRQPVCTMFSPDWRCYRN
jgi:hypothetical protein